MDMANSAAGIVFKRIITGMLSFVECDIIAPHIHIEKDERSSFNLLKCPKYFHLPYRIEKYLFNRKGYLFIDKLWSVRAFQIVKMSLEQNKYDAVLSFVYSNNYSPIILGAKIKEHSNLPWIVYSVDAIPVPKAWGRSETSWESLYLHLNRYIPKADAFFSSNPSMLRYETRTFTDFKGHSGVVLTPCDFRLSGRTNSCSNSNISFLYAGLIYGPRRLSSLLQGFTLFLNDFPDANLVFVGNNSLSQFDGFLDLVQSGSIKLHPFTHEIDYYYDQADILLDINAEIEDDVFLSSKVCNYLSYDKPIVSISQDGSPVRDLMSGYDSIMHCHHDAHEVYLAMKKASNIIGKVKGTRDPLLRIFSPEIIAKGFCDELECIVR